MAHAVHRQRDPTIYRVEDEVGEHEIQTYNLELLRPLVERYLATRGIKAHVGSDQYIYWVKHDPTCSVAPALYVLWGVPQSIAIGVWKVWEQGGVVPSFALEVVGTNPHKDYEEAPKRYAELGTSELVVFDPFASGGRSRFQRYRRTRGQFRLIERTDRDRVRSRELGCFLRAIGEGDACRLRLGLGPRGDELFPTAEEAERFAKEAANEAKEAALRRVAELETALRTLTQRSGKP